MNARTRMLIALMAGVAALCAWTPDASAQDVPPSISGTPAIGETLTAEPGRTERRARSSTYEWIRCAPDVTGCAGTGDTDLRYSVAEADAGRVLIFLQTVLFQNNKDTAVLRSPPTAVVPAPPPPPAPPTTSAPPTISGDARQSATLTAAGATWTGKEPITTSFTWLRCDATGENCDPLGGGATYVLTAADVGHRMRVRERAQNPDGSATSRSAASAPVLAATPPQTPPSPPSPTGAPEIVGMAQVGQTIVADPGIWASALPLTFTYQWRRCNEDGGSCDGIAGATSRSYAVTAADAGNRLRVAVTARSDAGSASGTSAPTSVVRAAVSQGSFDQTPTRDTPPTTPPTGTDSGGVPTAPGDTPPTTAPPVSQPSPMRRLAPVVVRFAGRFSGRDTIFRLVTVRLPAKASIEVRCSGRGCAKRVRKVSARRGLSRLRWLERRYRPGATIQVRVTRSGRVGAYTRMVIRRGAAPKRRDACLRPGSSRPVRCSSV